MSTDIYTFFTKPTGSVDLMFSADKWIRVELVLETAGPVAVSTRQSIDPVLSGKGILLQTNATIEFVLKRGDRLYITAQSINRVKVITEEIPWLEGIAGTLAGGLDSVRGAVMSLAGRRSQSAAPNAAQEKQVCAPEFQVPYFKK